MADLHASTERSNNSLLTIVRVKRKRTLETPEDIVIQNLSSQNPSKILTDALNKLGIDTIHDTNPHTAPSLPRPKKFRRLVTLTAIQLASTTPDQLHQLRSTAQHVPTASNDSISDAVVDEYQQRKRSFTDYTDNDTHSTQLRFEQVRRRRGLTHFELTESRADPLRSIATLYDVVCTATNEAEDDDVQAAQPSASRNGQKNDPHGNTWTACHASTKADGTTLLCNSQPMLRETVTQSTAPHSHGHAEKKKDFSHSETIDGDDAYVYDLYMEDDNLNNNNKKDAGYNGRTQSDFDNNDNSTTDEWYDMHLHGTAPVVHILDDDTWLVMEASDEEDSQCDSEDSNAEWYHGNDYPDDGEDEYDDGSDWGSRDNFGDGDDEGGLYYTTGYEQKERKKKDWFDDEDDYF